MTVAGDIRVLNVSGIPFERGRIQGEALRDLIQIGMEGWRESIQRTTGMYPDDYLDRFVQSTNFMPAIERWAPALLQEMNGIGQGANVPFSHIYAYQLVDEEWLFRAHHRRSKDPAAGEHCSALGVCDQGQALPILAQNMDVPSCYDGTQVLLRIQQPDSDLESLVFTAAGLMATTGLNNRGVGICCNTLADLAHSTEGLPVAFIVRNVLERSSRSSAVDFVRSIRHASGQNYTIGSPDGIVDLECSAHAVAQFRPGESRVFHTNHAIVNADRTAVDEGQPQLPSFRVEAPAAGETVSEDAPFVTNSELRFNAIEKVLAATSTPVTVDFVKSVLRTTDVPISVARDSGRGVLTLGSLIMELSVPPVLHLAPGPPAGTEYETHTFGA
ncbi:MAG: C45 family autoproteolytic acyltransferase/hydrolase [Chloroflexota bacterium]